MGECRCNNPQTCWGQVHSWRNSTEVNEVSLARQPHPEPSSRAANAAPGSPAARPSLSLGRGESRFFLVFGVFQRVCSQHRGRRWSDRLCDTSYLDLGNISPPFSRSAGLGFSVPGQREGSAAHTARLQGPASSYTLQPHHATAASSALVGSIQASCLSETGPQFFTP